MDRYSKKIISFLTITHLEPKETPNIFNQQNQTESNENQIELDVSDSAFSSDSCPSTSSCRYSENVEFSEFDLGKWIGKSALMTLAQKREMLRNCWKPSENYDFRKDAIDPTRRFIHSWLQLYTPWLTYSKQSLGALCLYCVLFPPTSVKGIIGAFVGTPFTRYKDMHEACKNHACTQWHKTSI